MGSQQTVSARATENRRTNRIVDAVAEIVGRETAERNDGRHRIARGDA